jgi:hypothetical protein
MRVLKLFEEAAPKQTRQHPYQEEKTRLAGYPPIGVERKAAAGHDAGHVRMVSQCRTPGVQHQGQSDPGA